MKILHISDLHLGKRLREYSLIPEQKYILNQILGIIAREKPAAVLIAGDVYDKSVAPAEAVELLDSFITELAGCATEVYIISGNHDSAERLAFGSKLIGRAGIHISAVFDGVMEKFTQCDEHGEVNFYLLPFIKPINVRRFYPEAEINSYTDAIKTVIDSADIDANERNVVIAHQFVTGAFRSDSEDVTVGGTDNIDGTVFERFDYVALGHLHRAQNVGSEKIRYSGTPLKYSFSEAKHKKSVSIVELGAKNSLKIHEIPLTPKNELREIRGTLAEILTADGPREDYIHAILTDEDELYDPIGELRRVYPNLLQLSYDNKRSRASGKIEDIEAEKLSPIELFCEFYERQNGQEMSESQREFTETLIEKIWGEEL